MFDYVALRAIHLNYPIELSDAIDAINISTDRDEAVDGVRVVEKALDGNVKGLCYLLDCVDARLAAEGAGQALGLDSHFLGKMIPFPSSLLAEAVDVAD